MRPAVTGGQAVVLQILAGRERASWNKQVRSSGAAMLGDVGRTEVELAHQQIEHLLADALLHFEPHRTPEATTAQLHLDRRQQVVGLFLFQGEVGVAGDPEHRMLFHHHAHEQRGAVGRR